MYTHTPIGEGNKALARNKPTPLAEDSSDLTPTKSKPDYKAKRLETLEKTHIRFWHPVIGDVCASRLTIAESMVPGNDPQQKLLRQVVVNKLKSISKKLARAIKGVRCVCVCV
jgi:hypothetical protein